MDRIAQLLSENKNLSTAYIFTASDDYSSGNGTSKITCPPAPMPGMKYQIVIMSIFLTVRTDNAAVQTFQDASATQILGVTKASPGVGPYPKFDFGTEGFALTAGDDFKHKMSAAGMAGSVEIQAYARIVNG